LLALPTLQSLHMDWPLSAMKRPAEHWSHAVACSAAETVPGAQLEQRGEARDEANLPATHAEHTDDSASEVNPRAHGAQTAAPGWSLIVPGAQATQATCPLSGCALPVAHRSHDSPDELD